MDIETYEARERPAPKLDYMIGGRSYNIPTILDEPMPLYQEITTSSPAEQEVLLLLREMRNLSMHGEDYIQYTPRLLETLSFSGKFDHNLTRATRGLFLTEYYREGAYKSPHTPNDRGRFFAGVAGQAQFMRDYVWNNPTAEPLKNQIVQRSNAVLEAHSKAHPVK